MADPKTESSGGGGMGSAGIKATGDFMTELAKLKAQRDMMRIQHQMDQRKRLADVMTEGSKAQSATLNQMVQNVSRGLM